MKKIILKILQIILNLFFLYLAGAIIYFALDSDGSPLSKIFLLIIAGLLAYIVGYESYAWFKNGMKD